MASCAPAESAASSPTVAKKPGRPSRVLVGEGEPLVVTVKGKQDVLLTTRDDLKQCNEVLFSLHVPNQLLCEWYRKVSNRMDYLPLLNASIVDGVVKVSNDSEELSQKLYRRAGQCFCSVSFASKYMVFSLYIGKLASEVEEVKGNSTRITAEKEFLAAYLSR